MLSFLKNIAPMQRLLDFSPQNETDSDSRVFRYETYSESFWKMPGLEGGVLFSHLVEFLSKPEKMAQYVVIEYRL